MHDTRQIKFGPSGNSISFYNEGFTATADTALWLKNRNLDLFEYSFGRGVRMSSETACLLGKNFKQQGIEISAHAPYYINFATEDAIKLGQSIGYVLTTIAKVKEMGGNRVVVHPASQGGYDRATAMNLTLDNFKRLIESLNKRELNDVLICIETMGKLGQIGSVDEVVEICKLDDRFIPCIDFGHVNCREQGVLKTKLNYNTIIAKLLDNLPKTNIFNMHVHFSKIMYSAKGEVKHLTFEDKFYGPPFEPMLESLIENNLAPHIICESDGTQAEDSQIMRQHYLKLTVDS
jgi:deoxyribonuclease-4